MKKPTKKMEEVMRAIQRKKRKKKQQEQDHDHTPSHTKLATEHPEVAYVVNGDGDWIKARSETQINYLKTIRENHITVAIGPAGTGKTFLPVAMALQALLNTEEVAKIIITRPVGKSRRLRQHS